MLLLLQKIAEGIAVTFFTFLKMKIKLQRFSQRIKTPTQGTSGPAGFDLYLTEKRVVLHCSSVPIPIDIDFIT